MYVRERVYLVVWGRVYTCSKVCVRCVRVRTRAYRCTSHSFWGLFPAHPSGTRVLLLRSAAWLPPRPASALRLSPLSSPPVFCQISPAQPPSGTTAQFSAFSQLLPPCRLSTPLTSILAVFPKLPAPASSSRPLLWFAFGLSAPSAQFPLPLLALRPGRSLPAAPPPPVWVRTGAPPSPPVWREAHGVRVRVTRADCGKSRSQR